MDFRPHVTKGVVAVLSIVALTFSKHPLRRIQTGRRRHLKPGALTKVATRQR